MKMLERGHNRETARKLTILLVLWSWGPVGQAWADGADPGRGKARVVFDQGHGERFLVEKNGALDLSKFADVFRSQGFSVDVNRELVTAQILAGATGLVISGPFTAFRDTEIEAIAAFVERGGRVCVSLHIAPPVAPLLGRLGVATSNGVVHESANLVDDKDLDFRVNRFRPHPITAGLVDFSVYGSWAVINGTADSEVIVRTTTAAWVDLNGNGRFDGDPEVKQSLGVVVSSEFGKGELIAFGDDAVFQNQFLHDGNLALANNVARWMLAATAQR